jgi:ABC-type glycerol-3-phosphate transport system permease component
VTANRSSQARDKTIWQRVLVVFALLVLVINGFYPIIWIFLTSIKNELELSTKPITYWPNDASFTNYLEIFRRGFSSIHSPSRVCLLFSA